MQSRLHRHDTGPGRFCHFDLTAAFLSKREQGAIFGRELLQGMLQSVEFLGIDRSRRLGNILMLLAERREDPPQFLPPEMIDAGIARHPEEPRLELRRILQSPDRANHLDEHLLREVFDRIAPARNRENETRDSPLIAHDQRMLRRFLSTLGSSHQRVQDFLGRLSLAIAFVCLA